MNLPLIRILGTPYRRDEGGKRGNWKITTGKDGRIIYQLNDENGKPFIYLLQLMQGVLIFTDANGNLLVGDHDFSYTLNRRFYANLLKSYQFYSGNIWYKIFISILSLWDETTISCVYSFYPRLFYLSTISNSQVIDSLKYSKEMFLHDCD